MAEILACSRAVDLAREMGTEKLIIESDSMEVIRLISQKKIDRSEYGLASEEVKRKLRGFRQIMLQWTRRSANAVAHRLAQEGLASGGYSTWLSAPPSFILNVLDEDYRNSSVII
uniref:RNase H type-1 domain-containing protein n=1 Tax=Leersia perrieri TaxID=77586 RepID=A0A0D9XDM1_9ORYZ